MENKATTPGRGFGAGGSEEGFGAPPLPNEILVASKSISSLCDPKIPIKLIQIKFINNPKSVKKFFTKVLTVGEKLFFILL